MFIDAGAPGSKPGRGLPIGNLRSQHFANFYLGPLDRLVTRDLRAGGYCRYMDDVLVLGDSRTALWEWHRRIEELVRTRLDLVLRPEVTRVLPVSEGAPFLGFVVFPGTIRFDRHRVRRWRSRMRSLQRGLDRGDLTGEAAQRAADSLIGWARHGDTFSMRRAWVTRRW
ncbi:MAG: RNA-directed DNA polymerase [Oligoflexia bacterium]|nr:RNA-directed DNA polymerase [Oligoflexia bacterium]